MKESKAPWRSLRDVSDEDLIKAVAKMSEELGIHGSGNGYSLYDAVRHEKEKLIPQENDQQEEL